MWVPVIGAIEVMPVSGHPDARISQLGDAQQGRVAHWQLISAGLSPRQIAGRLRRGSLIRRHRGVYAVGHRTPGPLSAEIEALLTVPLGSLLSHLSAGRRWRLALPPDDGVVDVTVCRNRGGRRRTGIRVHRADPIVLAIRGTIVDGLPVTCPEQTLLDLAAVLTPRELERALDEALAIGIVTVQSVTELVERSPGRQGRAVLRQLLRRRGEATVTRSAAEERMLALIRAAELPPPECNARVGEFTVDFLWRAAHVAVEVDGFQWHSTRSAFERDRRKDRALSAARIDLMRVTWRQMHAEALSLIADLARRIVHGERAHGPSGTAAR